MNPSETPLFPPLPIAANPVPDWFPANSELCRFFREFSPLYRWIYPNYRIELLRSFARLWPAGTRTVLDIGAGDGVLGSAIQKYFPKVKAQGIDVAARSHPRSLIPVELYNGRQLPFADQSFDLCIFSNVLHHVPAAGRPELLREMARVCRTCILIKDHLATTPWSHRVLGWMDFIGNAPFGAMVSATYLDAPQWTELFTHARLQPRAFQGLKVQAGPRSILFKDTLEIMFKLTPVRS